MTPQCLLIHGLLFFHNSCECDLCLAAGFPRYEAMVLLHCTLSVSWDVQTKSMDEEQDMLSESGVMSTKILTF